MYKPHHIASPDRSRKQATFLSRVPVHCITPFCSDALVSPPNLYPPWFTHIKHRFGALNTNLHFRLSRLPVVASTHLLPLRFEYLFTLRQGWAETYPVYDNPLQDCSAALFRYKSIANITVVMCDHVVFRVDARAFRYSQRT